MKLLPAFRRSSSVPGARGQTIILAVVSLVVLALIVFITFNVTVSVQQRIKLQSYADTKAFSMGVAEARTLNYLAYSNRAIAASYVGMANVHAYMSEAAQLADLKVGAASIMSSIAGKEKKLCLCCCTPFGCAPCCPTHCVDAIEAGINAVGLGIEALTGEMGGRVKKLDGPATQTVRALNAHMLAMRGSQMAAKFSVDGMLASNSFGSLKDDNMQEAAFVTADEDVVKAANAIQWTRAFDSRPSVKRQIMSEVVNASRQGFAWNRGGPLPIPPTAALFPAPMLGDRVKASLWVGPTGTWGISQSPDLGLLAGGRTGFRDGSFGMTALTGDVATTSDGRSVSSFDWSTLSGTWKHASGTSRLPVAAPIMTARLTTGDGNTHTAGLFPGDIFNNPHNGSDHGTSLDLSRFEEFRIGTSFPFNQPAVYAAATTDTRVNEYGQRGPWEVAKDGSGTINMKKVGPEDAKLTLTNNTRAKAFSKALVYYHRIGDWSDYPNLFNPYWRVKLQPVSEQELAALVGAVDSTAAQVAAGAIGINSSAVNVK